MPNSNFATAIKLSNERTAFVSNGFVTAAARSLGTDLKAGQPSAVYEIAGLNTRAMDLFAETFLARTKNRDLIYRLLGNIDAGQCAANCVTTSIDAILAGGGPLELNALKRVHAYPTDLVNVLENIGEAKQLKF